MPDPSSEAPIESTAQDVTSEPSAEPQNQGVGSLLDTVNAALGDTDPEAAPASQEPDPQDPDPNAPEADELSDEEKRHFSERAQHRFRELVEKQRAAEGERDQFKTELETAKPKAERMDQILGYMQSNRIAPEHLDNALGLTALIQRGEYDKALPYLENLISQVRSAAGDVLPQELQQRVNLGYITEDDAKALHKARLSARRVEERSAEERQNVERERAQQQAQTTVHTAVNTAEAWHKEQVTSDPDWNLKRDYVTQRMELELHRLGPQGYPRTPEAVRTMLDKIKAEVEQGLRRFKPAPKQINPSPTGGSASPRSTAKPKTLLEAVDMALETSE